MQKQISKYHEAYFAVAAFLLLSLYLLPLFLGSDGTLYVPPFDFLDISFPMAKILSESGMLFASNHTIIPNMMHGLPRFVFGSEFYYLPWLFKLFSPYYVYVINETLLHLTAFLGMLLLLRKVFYEQDPLLRYTLAYTVALLYAIIPFFPGMGMSIVSLPLFAYILLNIYHDTDKGVHWIVLCLLPFFTSFVLVYIFAISLVVLFYIFLLIIKKTNHKKLLIAITLLTLLYLIAEYRLLITMFFDNGFISHREEFIRRFIGFWDAYRGAHNEFLIGQSHSQSFQSPYIILTTLIVMTGISLSKWHHTRLYPFAILAAFIVGLLGGIEFFIYGKWFLPLIALAGILLWFLSPANRVYAASMLFIWASAGWYGFWYYEGWVHVIDHFPLLKIFDFSRFALLQPPVWYFLFALSSLYLIRYARKVGMMIVLFVLSMQCVLLWNARPFYENKDGLNFKSYYASELFERIEKTIRQPKESYKVASVGIPPAVSLFNGFYTLDGYSPNYPLSYKHRFRKIIEGNFKVNENSRRFFDDWGSQCYVIAGDKGYEKYEHGVPMHNFHFDTKAFKNLDGTYLLSGYPIENPEYLRLKLIDKFDNKDAFWSVWLYKPLH